MRVLKPYEAAIAPFLRQMLMSVMKRPEAHLSGRPADVCSPTSAGALPDFTHLGYRRTAALAITRDCGTGLSGLSRGSSRST